MAYHDRMENWVKIRNYKCFGAEPQGFDDIARFNIIVGRNNAGKSSLLDLAAFLTKPFPLQGNKFGAAEVLRMGRVDDSDYKRTFPADTSRSDIGRYSDYGQQFINKVVKWRITDRGSNEFIELLDANPLDPQFKSQLVSAKPNPLAGKVFRRLSAERDFQPEVETDDLKLTSTGVGATNIIQHYINDLGLPSELIEVTLLTALNEIFGPDAQFTRIGVQRLLDKRWEVFLDEDHKGRIVLSNSGSGLKTVLLVLLLMFVTSQLEGKALSSFVFALEELENNTHPALQRRLLLFLHRIALRERALFFLTTHSTVAIDFFSRDEHSQILHVIHDRKESRVQWVRAYEQNRAVLDDLDLRASDMLQANGLVWLEGPSDRLYFRRWVDLWSEGKLMEGIHYQCLFYGGRLLKHISCDEPGCDSARVQVLTINRNALIMIDSDLRSEDRALPETKRRIVAEFERLNEIAWVTAGKEIENYLPEAVLSEAVGVQVPSVSDTDTLWEVLNGVRVGLGEKHKRAKIELAEAVVPRLTRDHLNRLDLADELPRVCAQIAKWNGMRLPPAG